MAIDVKVIKVTRSENRYGKPMWILNTAGGDSIFVFDNMLEGPPWDKSRYRVLFEEMENQQADRWQSFPILATASEKGKYLTIISLGTPASDAKPDRTPELENVWEVYGPRWWSALHALGAEDTIVFDAETTGVNPDLDEAVSIAVRSYASPSGAPVKYHSLIRAAFSRKSCLSGVRRGSAPTTSMASTRPIWRISRPSRSCTRRCGRSCGRRTGCAGTPTLMLRCWTASAFVIACR